MAGRPKRSSRDRWINRSPKTWPASTADTWRRHSSKVMRGSRLRPRRHLGHRRRRMRRPAMRLTLLSELAQFLTQLEQAQENLLALLTAKRKAIDTFQSEELIRLSEREQVMAARLQELLKARMALLN